MVNRASMCALLLTVSAVCDDHSFEMMVNFESGTDGTPTPTLLSASTLALAPFTSGTWTTNGATEQTFFIWSGYNLPLNNSFWWNGVITNDAGTRGLAMSMDHADTSCDIRYRFSAGVLPISFGCMMIQNLTNTADQEFHDWLEFDDALGQNSGVVEYRTDPSGGWYAHGNSNNVTLNGPMITGIPVGSTNWVTGIYTESNYVMNVYNPFTHALLGTSSIGRPATNIVQFRFQNWMHHTNQIGITNYADNLVLVTNGVFPILPWEWVSAPFIRVVSP